MQYKTFYDVRPIKGNHKCYEYVPVTPSGPIVMMLDGEGNETVAGFVNTETLGGRSRERAYIAWKGQHPSGMVCEATGRYWSTVQDAIRGVQVFWLESGGG